MKPVLSYVLGIILLSLLTHQASCQCDDQHINSCWDPVASFLKTTNLKIDITKFRIETEVALLLNKQEINEFCSLWTGSTKPCMDDIRPSCNSNLQGFMIDGFINAYDFLCTTQAELIYFKNCLDPIVDNITRCTDIFTTHEKESFKETTLSGRDKHICIGIGETIECITKVSHTGCGLAAMNWVEEFHKRKMASFLQNQHSCNYGSFCSYQNIQKCYTELDDLLKSMNKEKFKLSLDLMFNNLDASGISALCGLYEKSVAVCFNDLKKTCDNYDLLFYQGEKEAMDFLCNEGNAEFMAYRQCFNDISGIDTCARQFLEDMKVANNLTYSPDRDRAHCRAIERVLNCSTDSVTKKCGGNQAAWYREFATHKMQPFIDSMQCTTITLQCKQSNIDYCWVPIMNYNASIGFKKSIYYLPELSETQVRGYCDVYLKTAFPCLQRIRPMCSKSVVTLFEGEEDSLLFLCSAALEEFLKHRSCLATNPVEREVDACTGELTREINLAYREDSFDTMHMLYCRAVEKNLDCEVKGISKACGNEAADWYKKFQGLFLEKYLDYWGCNKSSALSAGVKGLIAFIVLCLIAIVIISAIFIFQFIKKRKSASQQTDNAVRFRNPLSTNASSNITSNGTYGVDGSISYEHIDPETVTKHKKAADETGPDHINPDITGGIDMDITANTHGGFGYDRLEPEASSRVNNNEDRQSCDIIDDGDIHAEMKY